MRRTVYTIALASLFAALAACSDQPAAATNGDSVSATNGAATNSSAAAGADKTTAAAPVKAAAPVQKVNIPAGAKLRIALLDPLSSDKNKIGDTFTGTLTEPVLIDGKTVLEKGVKVRGRVVDAEESGRVKGLARLELTLTEIVPEGGKAVSVATRPYVSVAEATKKRDAAIIGGGAGVGAAIGAITGGKKGAAIGAGVGGGAGTGTVLATKGKEVEFDREHLLTFTLSKSLQL